MTPIAAVLFDLDDTLLDASAAWRAGVAHLIAEKAPDPSAVDLDRGVAAWNGAFRTWFPPYLDGQVGLAEHRVGRIRDWASALGLTGYEGAEPAWFDAWLRGYRTGWTRFPDVAPTLDGLTPLRLGIVTNGPGSLQREKLEALGLTDRFGAILVSEEFGAAKPDPGIFRAAAAALGVEPERCLMVGDLVERDVRGALAAGMRAAWIQRPDGPEFSTEVAADLVGRFATLTSLTEILTLVGLPPATLSAAAQGDRHDGRA